MEEKKPQIPKRLVIPDEVDEIEISVDRPRHIDVICRRKDREPRTKLLNITDRHNVSLV